jgi:hypothetical protein
VKYVTKPFEVEAIRFTGHNWHELKVFTGFHEIEARSGYTMSNFLPAKEMWPFPPAGIVAVVWDDIHSTWVGVREDDYIIKGMKGEFYPCDPEVFHTKYEEAHE